jgi:hypothetical protein
MPIESQCFQYVDTWHGACIACGMSLSRSQRRARAQAKHTALVAKVQRLPLSHPLRVAASGHAPKAGGEVVAGKPRLSPLNALGAAKPQAVAFARFEGRALRWKAES